MLQNPEVEAPTEIKGVKELLAQGEWDWGRAREQLLVLLPVQPGSPAPGLSLCPRHPWLAQPGNGCFALLPSGQDCPRVAISPRQQG